MIPLPLNIPCPWGFNQPFHPSVVYRRDGLFGHKYWLAQTPYPIMDREPYRDRYENPGIYFSDNAIDWYPIDNNPIDDLTDKQIADKCYFSDPHLIVVGDKLELFYRLREADDKNILFKRISFDGFNWSERIKIIDLHEINASDKYGQDIISPAICWDINEGYTCWYVDDSFQNLNRGVRYITSKDGLVWSDSQRCSIRGNIKPWHIDVQFFDNQYQMIIFDVDNQILDWYKGDKKNLFFYNKHLLSPSNNKWDFYEKGLYRACIVRTNDKYMIFFSAHNKVDSSIGLMESRNGEKFKIRSGEGLITTLKWSSWVYYKRLRRYVKKIIRQ